MVKIRQKLNQKICEIDSSHLCLQQFWQILNMKRKQWPETEAQMDRYLHSIASAMYPWMMIVITTKFLYSVFIYLDISNINLKQLFAAGMIISTTYTRILLSLISFIPRFHTVT